MCALAELMHDSGIIVSGSDRPEVFYTDSILMELNIPYHESFEAKHIQQGLDLVIYSAAYSFETNPEMAEAQRLKLPILKYTDALGCYSLGFDSSGIAGVHGKTTTTAIAGSLIRGAGLPAQILVGSAVKGFNDRSTLNLGKKYFVAETCEYRRHFLSFHPRRIILTSVESDHQDYYPTYESIRDAFMEYGRLLSAGTSDDAGTSGEASPGTPSEASPGELIYCADDPGACEVAAALEKEGRGIRFIPYGFTAAGSYQIRSYEVSDERAVMRIAGFPGDLKLRIPGRHEALNAAAALALTSSLVRKEFGGGKNGSGGDGWNEERRENVRKALEDFRGSKRRSEIIGEERGILFMDDYGHHPTAINTTLAGLKEFYPKRRLILSFMSHTYTRTASLLDEFAASFEKADLVILHKIYGSAREEYHGGVTGKTLFEKTNSLRNNVFYVDEPLEAADMLKGILKAGDLFVTMGAGDNWKLGKDLYEYYRGTGR
ncbi:UDP-N-acetylmuramate--L-alanine ligase [Spirochaetia bacterium]|nr:UDP-N-acetylmuramate--L-alanine ligase [Spirochaetia bacterium]